MGRPPTSPAPDNFESTAAKSCKRLLTQWSQKFRFWVPRGAWTTFRLPEANRRLRARRSTQQQTEISRLNFTVGIFYLRILNPLPGRKALSRSFKKFRPAFRVLIFTATARLKA